jgi:predicted  nucleic acid-binding Zn-ribbon protein
MAAGRQQALEAQTAVAAAAAAAQQVEQLTVQLASLQDRATKVEAETAHSRQQADIGMQAARDAEYRAVQTNTLLADTRREFDFTLKMLETAQQQQQQQQEQRMALTGAVSDDAAGKAEDAAAPAECVQRQLAI